MIINGTEVNISPWAYLQGANLQDANLQGASLRGANLQEANLQEANLREANLREASLRGADLREASLRGADLRGASLRGANLQGANLQGAKLPPFQIPPEVGSFIAWKKVSGTIVKLLIPEHARRTGSLIGRKCRASSAFTLEIEGGQPSVTSSGRGFTYTVGEEAVPDSYNDDFRVECSHGIHFFITRQEAVDY